MRIVKPMAGLGRHYPLKDVVACRLVCMPQRVTGRGKSHGKGIGRRIQPQSVEHLNKSKVHVYIVVQAGKVVVPPGNAVVVPLDGNIILNHGTVVLKLRWSAKTAADSLSGPSAFNLVHQDLFGKSNLGRQLFITRCTRRGTFHRNTQ